MADKKISALPAATTPLAGTEVLPIVQGGTTDKVSVANLTAGRSISASAVTADNEVYIPGGRLAMYRAAGSSYVDWASTFNLIFRTVTTPGGSGAVNLFGMEAGGNLTVDTGNLVIGTAGKGIDFSANTGAAGMTSELLDWYEEGTWSPTYTFDVNPTTPITMNVTSATYTRVGRQVSVRAFIATNGVNLTGASGTFYISGLPFPAGADEYSAVAMSFCRNWAGNYPSAGYVNGAVITMEYRATANGSTSLMTTADLSTSAGSNQNQIMIFASYFV